MVREGIVPCLRETVRVAAHGLFGHLRRRARPRGTGHRSGAAKEPAKHPGHRLLLFSVRLVDRCGRHWRVVLLSVAVFDLVLRRILGRFHRVRRMVSVDCAEEPRLVFILFLGSLKPDCSCLRDSRGKRAMPNQWLHIRCGADSLVWRITGNPRTSQRSNQIYFRLFHRIQT